MSEIGQCFHKVCVEPYHNRGEYCSLDAEALHEEAVIVIDHLSDLLYYQDGPWQAGKRYVQPEIDRTLASRDFSCALSSATGSPYLLQARLSHEKIGHSNLGQYEQYEIAAAVTSYGMGESLLTTKQLYTFEVRSSGFITATVEEYDYTVDTIATNDAGTSSIRKLTSYDCQYVVSEILQPLDEYQLVGDTEAYYSAQ